MKKVNRKEMLDKISATQSLRRTNTQDRSAPVIEKGIVFKEIEGRKKTIKEKTLKAINETTKTQANKQNCVITPIQNNENYRCTN